MVRVNLTGTWLLGREVAKAMTAAGTAGRIVNLTTVYAERVGPVPESAYYASKAGVANVTRALAAELGGRGISVNCLAPGVFYPTPMTAPLGADPDRLRWFAERTMLGRLGDPERRPRRPPALAGLPAHRRTSPARSCTSTVAGRPGDPHAPLPDPDTNPMTETRDPNRTALLLLDYQVALCEEGPHLRMPPLAAQVARARRPRDRREACSPPPGTAGWLVVHVRLAFDPTYVLRTNRLPRFDAYPDQRAMLADSPEAADRRPAGPDRRRARDRQGLRRPVRRHPAADASSPPRASATWCSGASPPTSSSSPPPGTPATPACQVTVVDDLCASFRPDFHDFSVQNLLPLFGTVTTADELIGSLCMSPQCLRRRGRRRRRGRPHRPPAPPPRTAPGSPSSSARPRPRPAATPATPRPSCGCTPSTRPPTDSRRPSSTTSWATPTRA